MLRFRRIGLSVAMLVAGCASTTNYVGAAPQDEQLYRRLSAILKVEGGERMTANPLLVAERFHEAIVNAKIDRRRAAEIQYSVISTYAKLLANAENFRSQLAESVFKNDPVGYLLAVGYGSLVDLNAPIERDLYRSLVSLLTPLGRRGSGTFAASYNEKAEIADLLVKAMQRNVLSAQSALLVFRLALNDTFGKTSLKDPQIHMVLRLAFFQHDMRGTAGPKSESIDRRVLETIEFVETIAILQANGWDDRAAVIQVLAHHFGNMARAIEFVLRHGWGAATGNTIDDVHKIGLILSTINAEVLVRAFAETTWAAPGFEPSNPETYGGANAFVFEFIFPIDSPQRQLKFPIENLGLSHPVGVRPTALRFLELKSVLGSWENVVRAVQVSNVQVEAHLIASLIYLAGPETGWGQLFLDAHSSIDRIVAGADLVYGAGHGWARFFATTKWNALHPVQQISELARSIAPDCVAGFESVAKVLGPAIERQPETNRRYAARGWEQLQGADACGKSEGGRQLFVEVFMVVWSEASPVKAVRLLARAMGVEQNVAFEFLAKSGFKGMSKDEFSRAYVAEDIELRRRALERLAMDEGG